jgi:shikimate kinase
MRHVRPPPPASALARLAAAEREGGQGRVNADKLYLVGFMGAGKTTIGRALSRRIGWRFEDIDERIEGRVRRSVASIFAQHGEPHFRQLEREVLSELLPQRQVIIATGGGTFAEPDNRALMLADGAVAWLDLPLAQVFDRVPADGRRPLAADRVAMEQLYARRRLAYAEAHVRIDASRSSAETVEQILNWIGF